MPVRTIIRPQFGEAVHEALGDLSPNQASYKTGVSDEYIRKMSQGRVPSEVIIERFASGLEADLDKLMVAAGYKPDPNPMTAVETALRAARPDLPPDVIDAISQFTRGVLEKYGQEEPGKEPGPG